MLRTLLQRWVRSSRLSFEKEKWRHAENDFTNLLQYDEFCNQQQKTEQESDPREEGKQNKKTHVVMNQKEKRTTKCEPEHKEMN